MLVKKMVVQELGESPFHVEVRRFQISLSASDVRSNIKEWNASNFGNILWMDETLQVKSSSIGRGNAQWKLRRALDDKKI